MAILYNCDDHFKRRILLVTHTQVKQGPAKRTPCSETVQTSLRRPVRGRPVSFPGFAWGFSKDSGSQLHLDVHLEVRKTTSRLQSKSHSAR